VQAEGFEADIKQTIARTNAAKAALGGGAEVRIEPFS
jgi:hypothetical protein